MISFLVTSVLASTFVADLVGALRVGNVTTNTSIIGSDSRPDLPPIGFIKTHKTGGSTIANILHRLGDARGLRFLLPADNIWLGWPEPFPGRWAGQQKGETPNHQFDVICNHAVFNKAQMSEFLKPTPFFFTILRHPLRQIESAFNYFPAVSGEFRWSRGLRFLEGVAQGGDIPNPVAQSCFRNPQAHDLGWYEWSGGQEQDQNEDAITSWIGQLNQDLDFVMLNEHFDEGLVLLRRRLGLSLDDVAEVSLKVSQGKHVPPSADEASKIQQLLRVDSALYQHFNQTFWSEWESAGGYAGLGGDLADLRARNAVLEDACRKKDKGVCTWRIQADSLMYTRWLKKKARTAANDL